MENYQAKTVIVIATALREGGALTIYKQFIDKLKYYNNGLKYVIFIDKSMPRDDIENVTYITVNTKSFIKRVLFDWFECARILRKNNIQPSLILSLQNIGIRSYINYPTIIYYHQSIPLYTYNWNPFKKDQRILFFYKWIYPLFVKFSISSNTIFIVQTNDIKNKLAYRFKINPKNISVIFPDFYLDNTKVIDIKTDSNYNFYYPAAYYCYKEHLTIVEAIREIKKINFGVYKKIKVHFTFFSNEAPRLYAMINKYKIEDRFIFEGKISYYELLSKVNKSRGVLFPSKLETLGLPLIEAATLGRPIIVSDLPYSREVLKGYLGANFVNFKDYRTWANEIIKLCYEEKQFVYKMESSSSWSRLFEIISHKIN